MGNANLAEITLKVVLYSEKKDASTDSMNPNTHMASATYETV